MNIYIGHWQSQNWPALLDEMEGWCEKYCFGKYNCDSNMDNWWFDSEPDGLMFILKFKNNETP